MSFERRFPGFRGDFGLCDRLSQKPSFLREWKWSFVAAGICIGLLAKSLPASSQILPGQCARAHAVAETHWEFRNNCSFPVYWAIVCAVGAVSCYGRGNVLVDPGNTESRDLAGGPWEIDGPYR
jgi:hypothetical protein